MPSSARLALAPAVALAALVAAGPAWAGTLPCDQYSRACETPSPTPPAGDDGGGGVVVPTPTQGATEEPGGTPTTPPPGDTGGDDGTDTSTDVDDDDGGATAGGTPVTGGGAVEGDTLPFTGGDLVLGALTGLAAVGAGTALVVAGRRRRTGLAG